MPTYDLRKALITGHNTPITHIQRNLHEVLNQKTASFYKFSPAFLSVKKRERRSEKKIKKKYSKDNTNDTHKV